ncbi:MAG: mismatch endonuclease, patch repair protein [Acidobacteriaceae bacterium]|jgi:hypothetical protein|nr:mismatch endonuclease, patch repair protein [Acidobacteriaceae bacterium]
MPTPRAQYAGTAPIDPARAQLVDAARTAWIGRLIDLSRRNPRKFRIPKSNCDYWTRKIERNRERDREVNKALKAMGWRVLRIWESALKHERTVIARLRLHLGQSAR